MMKTCTRCKIEKEDSEFRIRTNKDNDKTYLNPTCRKCDIDVARIYYNKHKDEPEFKRKNAERAKRYTESNADIVKQRRSTAEYLKKHAYWESNRYYKMRDKINARQKIKRQTPEYKAYMKAYRAARKEKIYRQELITKKRYTDKNRDSVSDEYCIAKIKVQKNINRDAITPEMIQIKRGQILIKRLKNKIAKIKNEKY